MEFKKITIQAIVDADRQKAWDYYTQPAHITQWNFASDTWKCPRASTELWVGGKYSARMEAKDGSFGFDFEAIYDEIVMGNRLVFSLLDGRRVEVSFESLGEKTQVTILFDAETENSLELQKNGWQAILNNFKKHVEEDGIE